MNKFLFTPVLLLLAFSFSSFGQITSDFSTNDDGWTILNSGSGAFSTPVYSGTGGNPGGFISDPGTTSGPIVFFADAPAKFRGNRSASYRQNLTFDLKVSTTGADNTNGDLIISGGSGTTLYFQLASKPAASFTSYTVKLDETFSTGGSWHVGSVGGAAPSKDQMKQVLGNITFLRIRLKYTTSNTFSVTGSIDNVVLNVATPGTPPAITSFSPTSGVPLANSVTINGTNFNATASNNAVYFGGVKAVVTSASVTQLIVTVPSGAQNAPIIVENLSTGLSASTITSFTPLFDNNKDYGGQIIRGSLAKPVAFDVITNGGKGTTAVGDIDGDGLNDLIVGEGAGGFSGAKQFSVFRNSGQTGTISATIFSSKVSVTTAKLYTKGYVALADFDVDGKLDVVLSSADNSYAYISVYRNTSSPGNISFAAELNWVGYSYSDGPLAAADVDGDGRPEILGVFNNNCASGDRLYIYQNLSTPGTIDFAAYQTFSSVYTCGGNITVGDLTGDKLNDVVVTAGSNSVTVFKNTSTPGTLSMAAAFQLSTTSNGNAVIADLDSDGLNDLAWPYSSTQDIIVKKNNYSGGTFDATSFSSDIFLSSPMGGSMDELTAGDFNGDSKIDLVLAGSSDIAIFENVGVANALNSNSFLEGVPFGTTGSSAYPISPLLADFDKDNKQDLLVRLSNVGTTGALLIYHNESYPVPKITSITPTGGALSASVTLTGDLMKTGNASPLVRLSGNLATVNPVDNLTTKVTPIIGAQSGKFILTEHGLAGQSKPYYLLFNTNRNITTSSFGPSIDFALSANIRDALAVADFDDDGKTDVGVVDNFSTTKLFQNSSTAGQPITASSLALQTTTYTAGYNLLPLDIDGDNKIDLHNGYGLLQNNSSGTISFLSGPNGVYTSSGGFLQIASADLNKDGKLDIAFTNGSAAIQVYENQSNADAFANNSYLSTFKPNSVSFSKPDTYGGIVTEDFDGDGYTDIISTNQTSGNLTFMLNNREYGPVTSSSFSFLGNYGTSGSQPIGLCANDFDGDGRMDIAVAYYNSAFVSVYRNNSSLGDISFSSPVDLVSANKGYNITSQDLDGDGKAEIVVIHQPNPGPGSFSVFQNKSTSGSISFNPVVNVALTRNPQAVNIADINLDQKPDILIVANSGTVGNALMVFENKITSNTITVTQQPVNPNHKCVGTNFTFSTDAIGTTNITFQWQKYNVNTLQWEDLANDATYSGTTTKNLLITNLQLAQDGNYRCVINGDFANTVYCNTGILTVHALPPTPVTTDGQRCDSGQVVISASGTTDGNFVWYNDGTNGEPIENENNSTYTTPVISTSTTYYVTIVDAYCETARTPVNANVINLTAPSVTGAGLCNSGSVVLNASGGTNGQYRWYTVSTGGTAITGEVNSTYTTPSLSVTTNYYVAINNGTCESTRTLVAATITTLPAAPSVIGSSACGSSATTLAASGAANGQYRWYTVPTGGTAISGEVNASYTTPVINASTDFYVAINNGVCEGPRTLVSATINALPSSPVTTGAASCSPASLSLSATGGANGQYRWYTVLTGGTAIAGEVNSTYTTPSLSSTTNYYVALNDGTCESTRTLVTATINSIPTAPTVVSAAACGTSSLTLTASGGTSGQYRWYTVSTGGTAISGEVNSTYATPAISATTDYYVSVNNGTCESTRTLVKATINSVPTAPTVTPGSGCGPNVAITLKASGATNGQYRWYKVGTGGSPIAGEVNDTYTTPPLMDSVSYYVSINNGTCESPRVQVLADVLSCVVNQPPVIKPADVSTQIEGVVTLNLLSLLSDPDNNIDLTKLSIAVQPKSGAVASIDANQNLIIDYKNLPFSGVDKLTIEVCDLAGSCVQQEISVEVVGDIIVFNGISSNNDGLNDRLELRYIDVIESTKNNHVSIFNRWGSKVFDVKDYNNTTHVFTGHNNSGDELPAGTYFYKIEFSSGKEMKTGYLTLKR